MKINADMTGDGRYKVEIRTETKEDLPAGTRPRTMTLGQARTIVCRFLATGFSHHNSLGEVMWVVVEYCNLNRIPYEIQTIREVAGRPIGYKIVNMDANG